MTVRGRAIASLVGLLVIFGISACIISRGVEVSRLTVDRQDSTEVHSPVRAHLVDGSTIAFRSGAVVANNRVTGGGWRYMPTLQESTFVEGIALDSVLGMEAFRTHVDEGRTFIYSSLATAGLLVGTVAAICISDPKCFGSCPTFYSDSAGTAILEAEGFSYSISPLLEARDVDRLRAQADSTGTLKLQVWNEALETHYINQLELLESVHAPNEFVLPDERARPVAVQHLTTPSIAIDRAGRDVRRLVAAAADSAIFVTDSGTLARASAADPNDYIDLRFPRPLGADSMAIVLRLRNSLLNTVLFYDLMLARSGARSIDWMANDLQRIGTTLDLGRWYRNYLGLRLMVEENGAWKQVARLSDYGPIAWRDVAAVIPVPPNGDSVHLRLEFLADQWRIDRIAIADHVRRPRTRTVALSGVFNAEGDAEPRALADLRRADERYLETTPPQRFTTTFDVGSAPRDSVRTFFIASQGYYTEWVRGSWMTGMRDTMPFRPGDAALQSVLHLWATQKDALEKSFYRTRIPVR